MKIQTPWLASFRLRCVKGVRSGLLQQRAVGLIAWYKQSARVRCSWISSKLAAILSVRKWDQADLVRSDSWLTSTVEVTPNFVSVDSTSTGGSENLPASVCGISISLCKWRKEWFTSPLRQGYGGASSSAWWGRMHGINNLRV